MYRKPGGKGRESWGPEGSWVGPEAGGTSSRMVGSPSAKRSRRTSGCASSGTMKNKTRNKCKTQKVVPKEDKRETRKNMLKQNKDGDSTLDKTRATDRCKNSERTDNREEA